MNERIKELAKQAGFDVEDRANEIWFDEGWHTSIVERFAELVRQDEREACAKLCDDLDRKWNQSGVRECAAAIRGRTE
jgi:hypothetical protein